VLNLVRYEDYWDADSIEVERVQFRGIEENTTRLILLEQGVLDMADIAFPHVRVAEESDDISLQTVPQLSIRYIGFNYQKPPFDDVRVRRAANYAINKEEMIEYVFFGVGEPARGPLPSIMPAFNDSIPSYDFDPDMARELLAEAGYPDGFDAVMWTQETGVYRQASDAVVGYLRDVGINVETKVIDNGAYWDKFDDYLTVDGQQFPTKEGVYDIYVGGWVGGETAHGFLEPLFQAYSYSNASFYINEEYEELLAQYKSVESPEKRDELYGRMQEIVVSDAPWIFAFHGQLNVGYNERVQNYRINASGRIFFEDVTLAGMEGTQ
jgi:peptide/nickel transport system substrate-binding protein